MHMQNTLLLAYQLIMEQTSSSLMAMLVAGVSLHFDIFCKTMFLTSHTSIWSQLNDGGVNKYFHQAIEQCCSTACHGYDKGVNNEYFNKNSVKAGNTF